MYDCGWQERGRAETDRDREAQKDERFMRESDREREERYSRYIVL